MFWYIISCRPLWVRPNIYIHCARVSSLTWVNLLQRWRWQTAIYFPFAFNSVWQLQGEWYTLRIDINQMERYVSLEHTHTPKIQEMQLIYDHFLRACIAIRRWPTHLCVFCNLYATSMRFYGHINCCFGIRRQQYKFNKFYGRIGDDPLSLKFKYHFHFFFAHRHDDLRGSSSALRGMCANELTLPTLIHAIEWISIPLFAIFLARKKKRWKREDKWHSGKYTRKHGGGAVMVTTMMIFMFLLPNLCSVARKFIHIVASSAWPPTSHI